MITFGMPPQSLHFIREIFHLSSRDLAKCLNVAPFTVDRWESGKCHPTGLQYEVLVGLRTLAVQLHQTDDRESGQKIGGLLTLGIGSLIFYLLEKEIRRHDGEKSKKDDLQKEE